MKKQNQTYQLAGRKLSLNKKTISNLSLPEMSSHVGGNTYVVYSCMRCNTNWCPTDYTCNGRTCNHRCTF